MVSKTHSPDKTDPISKIPYRILKRSANANFFRTKIEQEKTLSFKTLEKGLNVANRLIQFPFLTIEYFSLRKNCTQKTYGREK